MSQASALESLTRTGRRMLKQRMNNAGIDFKWYWRYDPEKRKVVEDFLTPKKLSKNQRKANRKKRK